LKDDSENILFITSFLLTYEKESAVAFGLQANYTDRLTTAAGEVSADFCG
jgi:hypothetical protein